MCLIDNGPDLTDPHQVGHKTARQIELAHTGIAKPPLICVPATVFDHVVTADPVIDRCLRDPAGDVADKAAELRRRLSGTALPAQLAAALDEKFTDLAGPEGLVAVRARVVPPCGRHGGGQDPADDPL